MSYKIEYSCCTHVGKRRRTNQDNFLCNGKWRQNVNDLMGISMAGDAKCSKPVVFGVFDGMGGEACGEIAAMIAAKCAADLKIGSQPIEDLKRYCSEANEEICKYADDNGVGSMGTTAAVMAFTKDRIYLCNIGDSRVYRFDGEKLEQISIDHYAMVTFGGKPPLSQNLGIPPTEMIIEPHLAMGYYNPDNVYLLCSDGLTDMVSDEEIADILRRSDIREAEDRLLNTALLNGGNDNITIILCKVVRERKGLLGRIFK